jgi:hypothetical protein
MKTLAGMIPLDLRFQTLDGPARPRFPFPRYVDFVIAGPEETKNPAGKCPPPDSDPFSDVELAKNLAGVSSQFAANANRRFKFDKCSQFFIDMHNKASGVLTLSSGNPKLPALVIRT